MSRNLLFVPLLLATSLVLANDPPDTARVPGPAEAPAQMEENVVPESERGASDAEAQAETEDGAKLISGMSILGNQEAPKALVIVPWKSSQLGESLGISTMLDDSRQPVDREVFMRALSYYEIRSEKTP